MRILIFLIFILTTTLASAQEWHTDFSNAQEIATTKNQNIVLVFQGSDWCAPCMKLENEIWNSEEFKTYAKENLVLLKADFPRRKKNKLSKEQKKRITHSQKNTINKVYFH